MSIKCKLFKSQNLDNGHFDVEFDIDGKGIVCRQQDLDYVHKIKALVEIGNNLAVGTFEDDIGISEAIEKNGFHKALNYVYTKQRFGDLKFAIPSTPSGLKKSENVKWYLCFEKDGVFSL
uniref:Uncharacterized protein n=1 Tax=Panagrolaimus davidi TaxID=227884 RepID=A0A914QEW8_9BILA